MEMDVEKTERAEAELNRFIVVRARQKEAANEEASLWSASERRHREKDREKNRVAWAAYHAQLSESHAQLSEAHREKARAFEEG